MNTVRTHRKRLGWSRAELSVRADVSYAYISQLEARAESDDAPKPGLDIARRLATALGVDVDALFPPVPSDAPAASEVSK